MGKKGPRSPWLPASAGVEPKGSGNGVFLAGKCSAVRQGVDAGLQLVAVSGGSLLIGCLRTSPGEW